MTILTFETDEDSTEKNLDQFYTNPSAARACINQLINKIEKLRQYNEINNIEDINFLEPSGGDGVFINELKNKGFLKIKSYDIEPKHNDIIKKNFLTIRLRYLKNRVTIGNPPFGKKGALAVEFFNHCSDMCSIVAFIVPLQFRKWSIQRKLDIEMKLISDITLNEDSFRKPNGKPYQVRCCFQVWTKLKYPIDKRLKKPPLLNHKDFEIWQYNNTVPALKYFENDFDFAVPRQGFSDYSRRETNKDNCEKTTQWMLIKAKNKKILKRLMSIDFEKLSKLNTTTPGFGKADVIKEYNRLRNKGG